MLRIILSLMLFSFTANAQQLTGKQIIEKSIKATKIAGTEMVSTIIIRDSKGNERIRKTAQVSKLFDKGDTEKRLIRFLSPADVKGTGFLVFDYENKDDDMWLYMPALRKTRRIISTEKSKSFMGSEFSYSDLTPPSINDFKYKLLKEEKLGNVDCYVVEILAGDEDIADENGYSKKISHVGKKDFIARKSIFYDLDGELLKELNVLEIKEVDTKNHKSRPTHITMVNFQNDRSSEFKIEKIKYTPNVKEEYFSTRYLERE